MGKVCSTCVEQSDHTKLRELRASCTDSKFVGNFCDKVACLVWD